MNNTGKILITKDGQLLDRLTKKKEIQSLLYYWWVNHFSDSYKITACSVNTSTVAGCFASFNKSENEIKIRREHKERPQGVVADRSVLDGVERNPPRQRKNSQFFPLASRRGTGCGAGPTSKFYVNLENEYKKVIEPLK